MLKIKGEEYPFLFANKASKEMLQCEKLAEKDDTYFIYLGLKYGSKREGKEFPLTQIELEDEFEDVDLYEQACMQLGEDMGRLKKIKALTLKAIEQI